jgi:hypothetical protein
MHFATCVPTPRRVVYDSWMVALARWFLAISFVTGTAIACGGSAFTAGTSGADGGGAGNPPPGDDGGGASTCVTPPTSTGDEADFCALETKLFDKCAPCEACLQTDLNNCVALGDVLSASFKGALDACSDQIGCGDYEGFANQPCVTGKLANATPTGAQSEAKTKYCTGCAASATGATDCLDFFKPPPGDGGVAGVGYIVLLSSDDVATSIETKCSTACGAVLYGACAVTQFCSGQAKDACGTGYCGK